MTRVSWPSFGSVQSDLRGQVTSSPGAIASPSVKDANGYSLPQRMITKLRETGSA